MLMEASRSFFFFGDSAPVMCPRLTYTQLSMKPTVMVSSAQMHVAQGTPLTSTCTAVQARTFAERRRR